MPVFSNLNNYFEDKNMQYTIIVKFLMSWFEILYQCCILLMLSFCFCCFVAVVLFVYFLVFVFSFLKNNNNKKRTTTNWDFIWGISVWDTLSSAFWKPYIDVSDTRTLQCWQWIPFNCAISSINTICPETQNIQHVSYIFNEKNLYCF